MIRIEPKRPHNDPHRQPPPTTPTLATGVNCPARLSPPPAVVAASCRRQTPALTASTSVTTTASPAARRSRHAQPPHAAGRPRSRPLPLPASAKPPRQISPQAGDGGGGGIRGCGGGCGCGGGGITNVRDDAQRRPHAVEEHRPPGAPRSPHPSPAHSQGRWGPLPPAHRLACRPPDGERAVDGPQPHRGGGGYGGCIRLCERMAGSEEEGGGVRGRVDRRRRRAAGGGRDLRGGGGRRMGSRGRSQGGRGGAHGRQGG